MIHRSINRAGGEEPIHPTYEETIGRDNNYERNENDPRIGSDRNARTNESEVVDVEVSCTPAIRSVLSRRRTNKRGKTNEARRTNERISTASIRNQTNERTNERTRSIDILVPRNEGSRSIERGNDPSIERAGDEETIHPKYDETIARDNYERNDAPFKKKSPYTPQQIRHTNERTLLVHY